jgi:serine/threonine protein kinase
MEMDAAPLAAVQHPNVVRLIGCTVQTSGHVTGLTEILTKLMHPSKKKHLHDEATGVLVMELMEGDLRKLMDQRCPKPGPSSRPFCLIVALDIMLQIAEAMRYVHQHKILHRDLKTTNILFNSASTQALPSYPTLDLERIKELELLYLLTPERFYTVKLADFGEAEYSPTESSHIVNANIGTPQYMAPEMFYNPKAEVPSEYSWSCDVYSFAMICSTILTGNEPFHDIKNSTQLKVMASIVDKMAQDQVRPDLGLGDALPKLKALIERCWNKDPLKRPPFSEIFKELWDCKVQATISCLQRQWA